MCCLFRPKWIGFMLRKFNSTEFMLYTTISHNQELQDKICRVVSSSIGGLDDLETSLNGSGVCLKSPIVSQIIDSCKHEAPTRRLLRFFLWSSKRLNLDLKDEDFNHAIRVLAERKDHTAIHILVSDLQKEGRVMEAKTFGLVAEVLVKLGREDEALGIFKNLEKFKCLQDGETVTAIISALCSKGHAKKAYGVFRHHKDKVSEVKPCIYRSLLYGWSVQKNVKEARKIIQEMKGDGITPDLFTYNTFLRCLCERDVVRNPSGLIPESLNVMMEMRSYRIEPNSVSYNILLSCLGRVRRVQESCRILEQMKKSSVAPDWASYYLVAKVLYLTGRFGKGNMIVDEMIEKGLVPDRKFYYDLIGVLCAVERVNFALELFERMKRSSLGGYGPVYDVLIPKLCRGGNFEKGKELFDEAMAAGITLHCSTDVLDPSITEVFKPTRKVKEEVKLKDRIASKIPKTQERVGKIKRKVKKKVATKKKQKKYSSK